MPLYEYECKKCNVVFEQIQSVSQRDNAQCEECESFDVKRKEVYETTMGCDANVKPPSWFKEKIDRIKGTVPKKYHDSLDQSSKTRWYASRSGETLTIICAYIPPFLVLFLIPFF